LIRGQKYPKPDYLCGLVKAVMNIQLIVILVLFAIAVYFVARKLMLSFGKNKHTGCAGCEPDQGKSKKT